MWHLSLIQLPGESILLSLLLNTAKRGKRIVGYQNEEKMKLKLTIVSCLIESRSNLSQKPLM